MYALGFVGDVAAKVLGRDIVLSTLAVHLLQIMSPDGSQQGRTGTWLAA